MQRVDELEEKSAVRLHTPADVADQDKLLFAYFAPAMCELEHRAAVLHIASKGASQVDLVSGAARPVAPTSTRRKLARQQCHRSPDLVQLIGGKTGEIALCEHFKWRRNGRGKRVIVSIGPLGGFGARDWYLLTWTSA